MGVRLITILLCASGILRSGSRKIFTPQQRRVGFRGLSCVSIVTSDYAWKARAIRGCFKRHLESVEPISPPVSVGFIWLFSFPRSTGGLLK